jgi:hypothetical protein
VKKSIEQRIAERKQQAKERDIANKAWMVALRLGTEHDRESPWQQGQRRSHTFRSGGLAIFLARWSTPSDPEDGMILGHVTLSIMVGHQEVFRQEESPHTCANEITSFTPQSDLLAYAPGTWEKTLDYLMLRVQKESAATAQEQEVADRQKREKIRIEEESQLRARWGF